ncbi:MAG: histidine kinase, partial [Ramlibacter sp.]|nr:histidine kinase [Ramlibacter sp.]
IANNVLHNVGNAFNSITVSASMLRGSIVNSRIEGLWRAIDMANDGELAQFMRGHPRADAFRFYLNELGEVLRSEQGEALDNLDRLARSVEHIDHVLATQQSHSGVSRVLEDAVPDEVVEEALRLSARVLADASITVVRSYAKVRSLRLDKQRVLQILVNLIRNATQAMDQLPEGARLLTVSTSLVRDDIGERLQISVKDCGIGIARENLQRIFMHGFTTRKGGHGFGLHSCALAALEVGGNLTADSEGLGRGAVFTLDLAFAPVPGAWPDSQ